MALLQDGTVLSWGEGALEPVAGLGVDSGAMETVPPAELDNVMGIAAGLNFSLALINDGTVRAWGNNESGLTGVPAGLGDTKMVAAGAYHALALAYSPILNYPVTVSEDLLLIYNGNSQDSVTVKNYYLAHRPMVGDANVLELHCPVGELTSQSDFVGQIKGPVLEWLEDNPTKRPRYWVLFKDIPSRFNVLAGENTSSVSFAMSGITPSRKAFVTHLNMRTLEDCTKYVDKLEAFGTAYSPGKVLIRARSNGYGNSTYWLDDVRGAIEIPRMGLAAMNAVLEQGADPSEIQYVDSTDFSDHFFTASNVAGYFGHGAHGGFQAGWPLNGYVTFTGNSGWHIIYTRESWNGLWIPSDYQGSFQDWFAQTTFLGSNYENTAVGAISHVCETWGALSDPAVFFGMWEAGKSFAISAWASRSDFFQATGDPLVAK